MKASKTTVHHFLLLRWETGRSKTAVILSLEWDRKQKCIPILHESIDESCSISPYRFDPELCLTKGCKAGSKWKTFRDTIVTRTVYKVGSQMNGQVFRPYVLRLVGLAVNCLSQLVFGWSVFAYRSYVDWQRFSHAVLCSFWSWKKAQGSGGGELLPYVGYIDMHSPRGLGFQPVWLSIVYTF